jgi:IS30 family transposase
MKLDIGAIAKRMGRHRSTIYRELGRNTYYGCYMPAIADEQAKRRHPAPVNKLEENQALNKFVVEGLAKCWSPEQISGRMKKDKEEFYACPESIYRYIYRNKDSGLYKLLPSKKSKRKSRSGRTRHEKRLHIISRNICYRSEEVELRNQIGHWEGDTIRFQKNQRTCVTTLVERKSRFVCLRKNEDKGSKTVMNHIYYAIKSTPKKLWSSLTFDQGSEFMDFRTVERQTKCKIFFCDSRSPWQRGSNENMNGRLRRYLPKDFEIDKIGQSDLDEIAILVNNTPRKCLGFQTPNEMISQHWKGFCRTAL